jgi:hypothetical protein
MNGVGHRATVPGHRRAADDPHDKGGHERGQRGDIAVGPLDQLSRRMGAVEGQVQLQRVPQQEPAQVVGDRPGELGGAVGGGDGKRLAREGHRDVGTRDERQRRDRSPFHRLVDEGAQQLRAGQRQRRADRQQQTQEGEAAAPPAQQRAEQQLSHHCSQVRS